MTDMRLLESTCAVSRSLGILGEKWTLLIIRDALAGVTRFGDFRKSLAITPDVLSDRLSTLVEFGVMKRVPYRDPGRRGRDEYHLTTAGRALHVVISALRQWGDEFLPPVQDQA